MRERERVCECGGEGGGKGERGRVDRIHICSVRLDS